MNIVDQIRIFIKEYINNVKQHQYKNLPEEIKIFKQKLLKDINNSKEREKYLKDLILLMLYYGTKLKILDLINLNYSDITITPEYRIKINKKQSILIDSETSEILILYLKYFEEEENLWKNTIDEKYMYKLLDQYPNENVTSQLIHFFPIYSETDYEIIPTPLRLNADYKYTGKGVTIAFIDSGFYPHPDLTKPINRILEYVNIAQPGKDDFYIPDDDSWHGMQTSVSAAGNGYLSKGLYKGIAHNANVVLLKVSDSRGIRTEYIIKALEWVIKNRDKYNIKIVNISLSGGEASSYLNNELDQTVEGTVQAGIVVVVAAGNSGDNPEENIIYPPASAPSAITVGGLDDRNKLDVNSYTMYRSSYGPTLDGILKPEIIAPGIWVAAPILPGSSVDKEAEILINSRNIPDEKLKNFLKENKKDIHLHENIFDKSIEDIRKDIENRIKEQKIIGRYYQHVDGTSFSSPIVASIIAQMLEANPYLTPKRIKEIMISTTDKIFNVPLQRQGYGLIHPRKCVKEAINDLHRRDYKRPSSPYVQGKKVIFYYQDSNATTVALAGNFNNWNKDINFLKKVSNDLWMLEADFFYPGTYKYKYVIDGNKWINDPESNNKEPDGFGGYNTRLNVLFKQ